MGIFSHNQKKLGFTCLLTLREIKNTATFTVYFFQRKVVDCVELQKEIEAVIKLVGISITRIGSRENVIELIKVARKTELSMTYFTRLSSCLVKNFCQYTSASSEIMAPIKNSRILIRSLPSEPAESIFFKHHHNTYKKRIL